MVQGIAMNELERKALLYKVIDHHKGILYQIARTYCHQADDRQDLMQEMLIQIWNSLHRYDPNYPLSTWLYRVALNVAISFYRKHSRRQPLQTPWIDELYLIPDDDAHKNHEPLRMLDQFILELNDFDKALLLLYLDNKSYAEMAEIMGLSLSYVGTQLGRIKIKLRKKFSLQPNPYE